MNKNKFTKFLSLFLLFDLLFLTGCNMLEIEDYAIVAGIGIDLNGNEYEVTYEIYEENDGQTTNMTSNIKTGKGKNISEAINEISSQLNRKPYLNHSSIVILNEEAVEKSFDDILNYLLHDVRIRSACYIMASKNQSTKQLFEKSKEQKKVIAFDIYKHLDIKEGIINKWSNCKLNEIINEKLTENGTVILPTITYDNDCDINGVYLINEDNKIITPSDDVFVFQLFNNNLLEGLFDMKGRTSYYIKKVTSNIEYIGNNLLVNINLKILTYEKINKEDIVQYVSNIKKELETIIFEVYQKYINKNIDPFRLYKYFNSYHPKVYEENINTYYNFIETINFEIDTNIDVMSLGLSEERI